MSLFCRHGRFTADCPICSKGTVLEDRQGTRRRRPPARSAKSGAREPAGGAFSGPHVASRAYDDGEGGRYVVRLEKVPGGVRLAEWAGSLLRRRAPVLEGSDLLRLAREAGSALPARDAERLAEAAGARAAADDGSGAGVSRGRAGDFREELRVEALGDGRVRVARWVLRPGSGWERQDAPPMLPAARFAEALADALRRGVVAAPAVSGATGRQRP